MHWLGVDYFVNFMLDYQVDCKLLRYATNE